MSTESKKISLLKEYEWLEKAIEMLDYRLIDRGFNINQEWLGYYDEYVLHYIPSKHWNGYEEETLSWGTLEIHEKQKVFNPYKYCNGNGIEYEKINELSMYEKQWRIVKEYISLNDYKINEKKICFDNPYPEPRIEFYQGSDVPISGRYE